LAVVALQQDLTEAERLLREVHTRAVAASNRAIAATALNNLGQVHKERKEYTAAHGNYRQALPLAREIGAQNSIALYLLNLADLDIKLGQLAAARTGLREGLALAVRLGALPWVVAAVTFFANLAHAEGQTKWALALLGLACQHPAWNSGNQRGMEVDLAEWALDPAVVDAGLKAGEALDWDATVRELLRA
jgi:tetratricopeptide (TPR) repeat protein